MRRHGQSWSHPLLVLLAHRNELSYNRFGFLVGKRIGGAVVRNRVKRRLREAMRARCGDMVSGWDVVLIARAPIVQSDFVRIAGALDSLLCRAGLTTARSEPPDTVG